MKVLILDKFSLFAVLFVVAGFGVIALGSDAVTPVYTAVGRNLPIYSVETPEQAVSVTFDTAWGNEDIDKVLQALSEAECKATFFLTGEWIDKFPEDTKKIHENGHEIANHSNEHAHFNSMSEARMLQEMDLCDEKIKNITASENKIFRAPYGEYNESLTILCKKTGRYIVQWSLDSLDYKGLTTAQMKDRLLPKLRPGDIILFHTGTDNTADALPEILLEIKNLGFSFKTTGDLIYKDNFRIDHAGRQFREGS